MHYIQNISFFFQKIWIKSLIYLPSPKNLSFGWRFGSFLGFIILIQIFSGFVLTFFYTNEFSLAFSSLEEIIRFRKIYKFRWIHINLSSLFFLFIFTHLFRGIYYERFKKKEVWNLGISILIILIATAFLGYSLPWGQISFWAVTVITKFFSVVPFLGSQIVLWIWGGFRVQTYTLKFFFSLHFFLPFLILIFVLLHILRLHKNGSQNPTFLNRKNSKIYFSPFFLVKDILNLILLLLFLFIINPWNSSEDLNFIEANTVSSPRHIKPEWYFLFAYAILRSTPNKLLGVILLGFSLIFFYFLSFKSISLNFRNYKKINKFLFLIFFINFCVLSWIGGNPVTNLFVILGQISSVIYFIIFILYIFLKNSKY